MLPLRWLEECRVVLPQWGPVWISIGGFVRRASVGVMPGRVVRELKREYEVFEISVVSFCHMQRCSHVSLDHLIELLR